LLGHCLAKNLTLAWRGPSVPFSVKTLIAKRLAIQVDDHEISFGDFEGKIPEGEYGAGIIQIWDRGSYEVETWSNDKIAFTLYGKRVDGRYSLVRFTKGRPTDWLLFKLPAANRLR